MNEFELIDRLIQSFGSLTSGQGVVVGPGDDAAVLDLPVGEQLVVSTDTLVPDVHFPAESAADLIGFRAIAVSVSDLTAMGAKPLAMTIAVTMPTLDPPWMERLAHGFAVAATEFDIQIAGGNLARGPLNITVTVHGTIATGQALLRSGMQLGDDIWVTGTLGATTVFLANPCCTDSDVEELLPHRDRCAQARYFLPHPRVLFGTSIRELAHAAIDISDGLDSELHHLSRASGYGAEIDLGRLPVWAGLQPSHVAGPDDSYELLFTASSSARQAILKCASDTQTPVVVLGNVVAEPTIEYQLDGKRIHVASGYDHFSSAT
ncbi:MAG: thiamine-phosphate kinase [Gammaproteobacteria bacterium]|nr:thiamine-phosphate kinase [Gammaproteobacteria bacterium]